METIEKFEPENLKLWTRPDHYAGAQWPDYYVFLGRHRDSDMITESNFDAAMKALGGESETVIIARASHWAVGWVESILIHKDDSAALQIADDLAAQLEDYPVLDESDLSERECEAAHEYWNGWRSEPDLQHRLWAIRDWNARHAGRHWQGVRVPFLAARHDLHTLSEKYPEFEQWIWEIARE